VSEVQSWIFFIVLIGLFLAAIVLVPQLLLRRAMRQVVGIFRRLEATSAERAKTVEELGLKPRSLTQNLLRGRDYKQYALQIMLRAQIIQMAEGERLYLSEENLGASRLIKAPPPSVSL